VPIFSAESKPNASDQLVACIAGVQSALYVAFLAEQTLFEDHVVQSNLLTTNAADETPLVPSEQFSCSTFHFHSILPSDLGLAGVTSWQVARKETVLAEKTFASLFVIFLVDQGDVALSTYEASLVPVLFPIKDKVFHMDGEFARLATI